MIKTDKVMYLKMTTPDGTVVENTQYGKSANHADKNGKEYWVYGIRNTSIHHSNHGDEKIEYLTVNSPHGQLREKCTWGTRGKNGDQPLARIAIKDMSEDHLEACLRTQPHMATDYRILMENELKYRWLYDSGMILTEMEKQHD